jgi:hypothetical protein
MSTGYTSATIAYDLDTNPRKRRFSPFFFGIVPDKGRFVFMALLMATSALQFAGRALSYALLAALGDGLAWKFYLADMGLYLFVKAARDDLTYWVPFPSRGEQVALSLLQRVGAKTVIDFTGNIIFRHPFEMGGAVWTANMCVGQLAVFGITYLFTAEERGGRAISDEMIWKVVFCVFGALFLSFALLLWNATPGYLQTFWDTRTASRTNNDLFLLSDDAETKLQVFTDTAAYWEGIRDELKRYVLENYAAWDAEKPMFWKDALKQRIPEDMIPEEKRKGLVRIAKLTSGKLALAALEISGGNKMFGSTTGDYDGDEFGQEEDEDEGEEDWCNAYAIAEGDEQLEEAYESQSMYVAVPAGSVLMSDLSSYTGSRASEEFVTISPRHDTGVHHQQYSSGYITSAQHSGAHDEVVPEVAGRRSWFDMRVM